MRLQARPRWELERSLRRRRYVDIAVRLLVAGLIVVAAYLFLIILYQLA